MAVQIYYQLIRDIVIDEQLLSMLQPQRRKQLFSFRLESDQKRCAAHHTVCDFPDYLSCVCYKCLQ